jgi:hypothetical protein
MAEERIGAVPGAGEREVGGGGAGFAPGGGVRGHHRAQERAGSDQDGEQGEQAAGLGLAWTRVGEGVPGLVQPPKLETFHEAEFFGIPEPERGAFLESGGYRRLRCSATAAAVIEGDRRRRASPATAAVPQPRTAAAKG